MRWWRSLLASVAFILDDSFATIADVCRNASFQLHVGDNSWSREPRLQSPTPVEDLDADFAQVIRLIRGRRTLEIGGPSADHTPFQGIYDFMASCDNVVKPDQHKYFAKVHDGSNFVVPTDMGKRKRRMGQIFRMDGATVNRLKNSSYNLVFASHVLEHFRDPLRALQGWDRVLEAGGLLFVVLPWRKHTHDRFRPPHTMQHLLRRRISREWRGPGRRDPDLEQILRTLDYDGTVNGRAKDLESMRKLVLDDKGGMELLHWHVFDFDLLIQLCECLAYEIQYIGLWAPYHQVVVAKKPAEATL